MIINNSFRSSEEQEDTKPVNEALSNDADFPNSNSKLDFEGHGNTNYDSEDSEDEHRVEREVGRDIAGIIEKERIAEERLRAAEEYNEAWHEQFDDAYERAYEEESDLLNEQ